MKLQGSCHCGSVAFSVDSIAPYPYMRCFCSICRKTAGAGGFAINLHAQSETLDVEGEENISVYHAVLENGERSPAVRHFCKDCGSFLWLFDPRWPELIHPFASPAYVNIMLDSKASWVEVPAGSQDEHYAEYPELSIVEWHRVHGLLRED
ncbi:MAG: GFA family protein [Proteobacteria bacterium]|nr:GFA family protein [Pseudomonadota bacterium]